MEWDLDVIMYDHCMETSSLNNLSITWTQFKQKSHLEQITGFR